MIPASEVIDFMSELAPKKYILEWDNSGLQVGDNNASISKILVSLDIDLEVAREAVNKNCDMIISHHPLIFKPLKQVISSDQTGKIVSYLIKNDIVLYSAHTNLDIAPGGLNDYLAQRLDIQDVSVLGAEGRLNFYKLAVFVPISHFTDIREAILDEGAGFTGNYSHSSFAVKGQGSFKPLSGSKPYQGEKNRFNEVQEYRLETIVAEDHLQAVENRLREVHPYEEVALDIYPLENNKQPYGPGRIGVLNEEMMVDNFLQYVKEKLNLSAVKFTGEGRRTVKKIALCSGSGGDYIQQAVQKGADLFLTGDIKFHQAQQAGKQGIVVVDACHYGTEIIVKDLLFGKIKNGLPDMQTAVSEVNTNPWNKI